jgi:hypothetical protein
MPDLVDHTCVDGMAAVDPRWECGDQFPRTPQVALSTDESITAERTRKLLRLN